MRKRAWQSIVRHLPHPRKSWWYGVYAFVLGAIPAAAVAGSTDRLGLLPIMVAVITWFGCWAIWFVAERLI